MIEKQKKELFEAKMAQVLRGHINELGSMEKAIVTASASRTEIPNLKEIFKELSTTAYEIHSMIQYYGGGIAPADMTNLIQQTLLRNLGVYIGARPVSLTGRVQTRATLTYTPRAAIKAIRGVLVANKSEPLSTVRS